MRIHLEAELGKGGHSSVEFARDVDTLEPVAAKVMELDSSGKRLFKREAQLMSQLPQHKNLPKLYGISKGGKQGEEVGYIVLEYLPFPTLAEFIKKNGKISEADAAHILRQLVDVVATLTASGVAHRDLKPENMMINPDNLHIKLIDFGLGHTIVGEAAEDSSYRGTPIYMAPEVLTEAKGYNVIKSELWSIGIIFYELLTGVQPFAHYKTVEVLAAGQRKPLKYDGFSPNAVKLLQCLLQYHQKDRADLAKIRATLEDAFPKSPIPSKHAWSSSRAVTFENLSVFSEVQERARTGEKPGVFSKRMLRAQQDLLEEEEESPPPREERSMSLDATH